MRRHLYSCFNAGKVTCFPEKLSLSARDGGLKREDVINVYCHCRMPEMKNVQMIECCMFGVVL